MTDKKIIMDDVNVASCIHLFNEENKPRTCFIDDTPCIYNHYCYFKQLAREKQNNKEYKDRINKYEQVFKEIRDMCKTYYYEEIAPIENKINEVLDKI